MKLLMREQLLRSMTSGTLYRRQSLSKISKNVDRDLAYLLKNKLIRKDGPGLYMKPKQSRFGALPPSDFALVSAYLKKEFLMLSRNDYNMLGLGLTQAYNEMVVYNHERHAKIKLGGRVFSFIRPSNGFPKQMTKEFLLVDLLNNLKLLTEDVQNMHEKVMTNLYNFDLKKLEKLSKQYGKVSTRYFFSHLMEDVHVSA